MDSSLEGLWTGAKCSEWARGSEGGGWTQSGLWSADGAVESLEALLKLQHPCWSLATTTLKITRHRAWMGVPDTGRRTERGPWRVSVAVYRSSLYNGLHLSACLGFFRVKNWGITVCREQLGRKMVGVHLTARTRAHKHVMTCVQAQS